MSKELIERLREAAAQRVASTAMIGAEDLSAAADALELATAGINAYSKELGSCRRAAGFGSDNDPMAQEGFDAFGDPLCVAAFVESQFKRIVAERDALAAELKALRELSDSSRVQWWLASLDRYGNPHLEDGAHSSRDGADKAAYLIGSMGLGAGKTFAVARVEISEPKPSGSGVNLEAVAIINSIKPQSIERHLKGEGE